MKQITIRNKLQNVTSLLIITTYSYSMNTMHPLNNPQSRHSNNNIRYSHHQIVHAFTKVQNLRNLLAFLRKRRTNLQQVRIMIFLYIATLR